MSEFHEHIQKTYPGLRRFIQLVRSPETGETAVMVFDLDISADEPTHVFIVHPRDILNAGGIVIPGYSYAEYQKMGETGEQPVGMILATNYPKPVGPVQ